MHKRQQTQYFNVLYFNLPKFKECKENELNK